MTLLKTVAKLALLGVFAIAANATTFNVTTGSITGTLIVDLGSSTIQNFDVRGSGTLDVFEGVNYVGTVAFSDLGNPAPNFNLTAYNAIFTQSGQLTLDGTNGVIVGGTDYLVGSTGTVVVGPITDAALADVLKPLVFDFTIANGTQISGNIYGFDLTLNQVVAATPEPAALQLVFGGLLAGGTWNLRKRLIRR